MSNSINKSLAQQSVFRKVQKTFPSKKIVASNSVFSRCWLLLQACNTIPKYLSSWQIQSAFRTTKGRMKLKTDYRAADKKFFSFDDFTWSKELSERLTFLKQNFCHKKPKVPRH